MFSNNHFRILSLLLTTLLLTGCHRNTIGNAAGVPGDSLLRGHLSSVPVCQIIFSGRKKDALDNRHDNAGINCGSAVNLGDNRLLTARHVIINAGELLTVRLPNTEIPTMTRYRIVNESSGSDPRIDDWVIIEVMDMTMPESQFPIDLSYPVWAEPGMEVWVIGYPARPTKPTSVAEMLDIPLTVVPGRIVLPPFAGLMNLNKEMALIQMPDSITYEGMSGGPVMWFDESENRLKLLGIYGGSAIYGMLGLDLWSAYDIRILPFP